MTTQKQSALQTIEEKKSLIVDIADKVWEFAELSLQEFKSAAAYCEALEKEGFDGNAEPAILRLRLKHHMDTDDHI